MTAKRHQVVRRRCVVFLAPILSCLLSAQAQVESAIEPDKVLRLRLSDQIAPVDTRLSQEPVEPVPTRPRKVAATGLRLGLSAEMSHDNNLFASAIDPVSDFARILSPSVELRGALGKHQLTLAYKGKRANYARFHGEDYFNHDVNAGLVLDVHRKVKVKLDSNIDFGSDSRGDLTASDVISSTPDAWRRHGLGVKVELGRRIAKAQISAHYALSGTRYVNNAQGIRDIDQRALGLEARWNISPKFSVLGRGNASFTNYLDASSPLDSKEYNALIGVAWEATAKTSGEFLVGVLHKDFYDPARKSSNNYSWSGKATWAPRSFSKLSATASRSAQESAAGGSGTALVDTVGLGWRHGLTNRLAWNMALSLNTGDYGRGRTSQQVISEFALSYEVSRWLGLELGFQSTRRSSRPDRNDFGDQTLFFRLDGSWDRRSSEQEN